MSRCRIITVDEIEKAFDRAISPYKNIIHEQTLIDHVARNLHITSGQLKAGYIKVFLVSNMSKLGWVYHESMGKFYRVINEFSQTCKQLLISAKHAGYTKTNILKLTLFIDNTFNGFVTGCSLDPDEVTLTDKNRGIRLIVKRDDLW